MWWESGNALWIARPVFSRSFARLRSGLPALVSLTVGLQLSVLSVRHDSRIAGVVSVTYPRIGTSLSIGGDASLDFVHLCICLFCSPWFTYIWCWWNPNHHSWDEVSLQLLDFKSSYGFRLEANLNFGIWNLLLDRSWQRISSQFNLFWSLWRFPVVSLFALHKFVVASSLFRLWIGLALYESCRLLFLASKRGDSCALGFAACDFGNNSNISSFLHHWTELQSCRLCLLLSMHRRGAITPSKEVVAVFVFQQRYWRPFWILV